jgi:chemosensory pili system protein ChpA (sensor histidine kinase/response regulator)
MVPFSQTADRLPSNRNISLKLHKQAKLEVEGGDVLIDKIILKHLNSPMTHLVNNAITHGIESPQERMAKRETCPRYHLCQGISTGQSNCDHR